MPTRPPERPRVDVHDDRFVGLIDSDAMLRHLADGCAWAEGPVYVPRREELWWSDVRNDRRLRLDISSGRVDVIARPANFANGHTLDDAGDVIVCEHGTRSVVRLSADGRRTVLASAFDGMRLNSPNDVVVASDGSIWFTDPTYGIDSDAEGYAAESEIGASNVYRVDPATGVVTAEVTDMVRPNGLAFSIDERSLFVSDTGVSHVENGPRHIRRWNVEPSRGVSGGGEVFATCPQGVVDGFRLDGDGRIWASGELGVHCYGDDGALLGTIRLPETCSNVEFGGPEGTTLFMTATTSLYAMDVRVRGASR